MRFRPPNAEPDHENSDAGQRLSPGGQKAHSSHVDSTARARSPPSSSRVLVLIEFDTGRAHPLPTLAGVRLDQVIDPPEPLAGVAHHDGDGYATPDAPASSPTDHSSERSDAHVPLQLGVPLYVYLYVQLNALSTL